MKLSVVDQSPIPAGFTAADALHNTIDLAKFTESLGYTRFWIAEHHATPSLASSAPEIMITRVAAETSTIRVGSGGVMLSHYAPMKVVEQFRVLHALYPDRVDLGVGRAPGGSPIESYALQRERSQRHVDEDDFPHQLIEMMGFLHGRFRPEHAFSRIQISPSMPGAPDVWLLGSSGWSADAAAQLGLPYAAAHFINPDGTRAALKGYFARFSPSAFYEEPTALVAVGVVCADTDEEAERLHSSQRLRRLLRDRGEAERGGPIPTPEEALARLGELGPASPPPTREEFPRMIVGGPGQVQQQLVAMADAFGVDEIMVVTVVHDHEARKHSYELLAQMFDLTPGG